MCNHEAANLIWELISLFIGALLSAITTIILIMLFRPKICFDLPSLNQEGNLKVVKIPVTNLSKHFNAVNLRIEATVVLNDKTYHFDLDRQDFIMLSKNNDTLQDTPYKRVYQAHDVASFTKLIAPNCNNLDDLLTILEEEKAYFRVRIHAYHEFTGFGKAFEAQFKYKNNIFSRIS